GAPAPGANGTGSVYWFAFASHRGGAPTIERATPPRRSTRPGCERGRLGVLVCLRFAPRRCSYNRTRHPTCRSTPPGCERTGSVFWFAFASHRGGAPTIERATPPCRSIRPGCEQGRLGVLVCLRFAPRRCSYNRTRHPHPVGAPAPGANKAGSVYWFAFASHRGGAPTIERVPPSCRSTRPGCEQTIARPTPRPAVRQTERTAPSLTRPL